MTNYSIKTDVFVRLANVCKFFHPSVDDETKNLLSVIRLENYKGNQLAIVTNQSLACIERIGKTDDKNSACHVRVDANILKHLEQEALFGSYLSVTTIPELATSTAQTTMGMQFPNCCAWFDSTPMDKWLEWGVEPAVQSLGEMYWDVDEVEMLMRSSPSGKVIFPEFIDAEKPVTIRDIYSPEWVGIFIPRPRVGEKIKQKAELPEWWVK